MDMEKNSVETKVIKTEIADEEPSLHNIKLENSENAMMVSEIKKEEIVVKTEFKSDGIEETINIMDVQKNLIESKLIKTEITDEDIENDIKTEFKSEDMEGTFEFDYVGHESRYEVTENFETNLKYEMKNEELNILHPSLNCEEDVDLKSSAICDTVTVTESPSDNQYYIKKRCKKPGLNYPSSTGRRGKDISFRCFHCNYSTNFKANLLRHMLLHDKRNKKMFCCTDCDYSTKYKQDLERHLIKIHSENSCIYCEKDFKRKILLEEHIVKEHQNFIDSVSSKVHNCPTCGFKTTVKAKLKRHFIESHSGDQHSCTCCEKRYKNKKSLDNHIIKNHKNLIDLVTNTVYNCLLCEYKTTKNDNLKYHMTNTHLGNYKKYSCTCCDKQYKKKVDLDDHIMKNHQNVADSVTSKIYNCPACDYKTTLKALLRRHTIQLHSEKHSCVHCGKHFKRKVTLDDHIIKNHQSFMDTVSSKILTCTVCDYKTTETANLRVHTKRLHSGKSEQYECTTCGKAFKGKRSLDHHILKHHENMIDSVSSKIFNCESCEYKTTMKFLLREHTERVHLGNYKKHYEKHLCTYCEKEFTRKVTLDEHILKYHQDFIDLISRKVYECVSCNYKTTVKSQLTRHTASQLHSYNYQKHVKEEKSFDAITTIQNNKK